MVQTVLTYYQATLSLVDLIKYPKTRMTMLEMQLIRCIRSYLISCVVVMNLKQTPHQLRMFPELPTTTMLT